MVQSLHNKKIVVAGGSGFLGTSLSHHLRLSGAEVVVLSRKEPFADGSVRRVTWDARTIGDWQQELNHADGLINLTGRSVDCVKTSHHKDEILRSRVESTCVLGRAIRGIETPPAVWVQMSTAHIYGDPLTAVCTEDSSQGIGFAPFVAQAWEDAFHLSLLPSQRGVVLRTSFVLGHDRGAGAGALNKLEMLANIGLGGRVGSGRQGISWIHETDLNRLFERALLDPALQGVYVATAPNPVSQSEFMRELRCAVRMPFGLPAFSWMVHLGARLLSTDPELALFGRYVVSKRLKEAGFDFDFPTVGAAIQDVIAGSR